MNVRKYGLVVAFCATLAAGPAWALDLHGARASGVLGEKNDGYVAVLKESPDADALAKDVNDKRQVEYQKISARTKQPVEVVATLAAQQIVTKLDAGDRYQDASGQWRTH